ncbi:uncharacterized protein G2W53_031015 [Senna tora]|uniref:Uncharacterized protein n=1 Tax=Senna tora TaxID=362788 RepID=A0A834T8G8_9FABA|nr:uncharacterized protein G2W53_031015 [Senna tora]
MESMRVTYINIRSEDGKENDANYSKHHHRKHMSSPTPNGVNSTRFRHGSSSSRKLQAVVAIGARRRSGFLLREAAALPSAVAEARRE